MKMIEDIFFSSNSAVEMYANILKSKYELIIFGENLTCKIS